MNFNPGLKKAGMDPKMVDQLIEVQKMPIESAKTKVDKVKTEKAEYEKLDGLLSGLNTSLNGLKTKTDFFKLKLNSSHPDIIDGLVEPGALIGRYEMEVRGMAKADKDLAYGFPDRDKTPVGFGFMMIEKTNGDFFEVTVPPNSTFARCCDEDQWFR